MLAANGKLFVTTDLETWEEVTDFSTIDDGALPKSLGYWSQAHKVLIGTGGTEASVYTIDHNLVRSEIFGEIIEDESDNDSEGEVAGSFSEDTKCRWSTPPDPTWIKWAPAEVDGKSGVMLTWVQYFANKVNIKIDDGTSTFPWKVHETLNDGHEFLENVGGWQQIKIKPIHHCNSGVYSQPLKLLDYPDGWYNVQK